jgi:hypothetical protein
MSGEHPGGMGRKNALRMEFGIIGLGIFALLLIFQPFSIGLFSFGCMVVVLAGLLNNLLPLAQSNVRIKSVVTIGMVVFMTFCIVILVAIVSAYLYGVFFLNPPDPNTTAGKVMLSATPFYLHPFVWSVAGIATVLAVLIWRSNKNSG